MKPILFISSCLSRYCNGLGLALLVLLVRRYAMKSSNFFYSIVLVVVFAIIGFVGSSLIVNSASAEEIISIATLEYHPWTGKNLKFNGFVNHVITEAFRRKGYSVKFTYLPFKRGVIETKNGQYSALSYVYWSKNRGKEFYLSEPISEEKIVFFHLKSNPIKDWKTLDDLKNYKFGATRGYTYTKEFWQAIESKRLKADLADSDMQNFKKLLAGRIDIFPSGLVNGFSLLQKEFDPDKSQLLTYHLKPLSNTTGHLAFTRSRHDSANLLQIFNRRACETERRRVI
jgi:polar amino acid transport system substrate-binding protein